MNVEYTQVVYCFKCDAPILMSESRYRHLLRTKENFYCCNGHEQHFIGQTEDQKKIAELERQIGFLKKDVAWANTRMGELRAEAELFKCVHPRCRFTHKIRKVVLDHMKDCTRRVPLKQLAANAGPSAKNSKVWQS